MQIMCIIFPSLAFLVVRLLPALLPGCMSATGEHHQLWTMLLKLLPEQGFILPCITSCRSSCQEHLKYILIIQSQLRVTQRKENGSWWQSTAQLLCLLVGDSAMTIIPTCLSGNNIIHHGLWQKHLQKFSSIQKLCIALTKILAFECFSLDTKFFLTIKSKISYNELLFFKSQYPIIIILILLPSMLQ